MSLTAKDKKVIERFTDRAGIGLHSRSLVTDGHRLDIYGLGGHGVAEWKNGKIVLRPLGGLYEAKIHRYIRKIVPPNWLADAEERAEVRKRRRSTSRDKVSKPKKERYRMAYKHKTSFHRLGEGIIGRTTGSELHLASAESWREQAGRMEDPKRRKEFLAHARAHEKRAGSKMMQKSHRRVLEGELWKVWPKEFKYPASARHGSRRSIRMKTREGYEDRELQSLTDDEIMHLLHPARRDPGSRRGSMRRDASPRLVKDFDRRNLLATKSFDDRFLCSRLQSRRLEGLSLEALCK